MASTPKLIDNFRSDGSSALCLDIRHSTQLVRKFLTLEKLKFHADFMRDVKNIVFENNHEYFTVNDTGDGFICLFWGKAHAWEALKLAVKIEEYLNQKKQEYDRFLKKHRIQMEFGFGIGLHSGASIVHRYPDIKKDFMYGYVLNTTARLESFTKTFKDVHLLMSGSFLSVLKNQTEEYNKTLEVPVDYKSFVKDNIRAVTSDKVEIHDSKRGGHSLHTITKENKISTITSRKTRKTK